MSNVAHHVVIDRDLTVRGTTGYPPFHLKCTSCSFAVTVATHEYAMASIKEHQLDPTEDWKYPHAFETINDADEWADLYRRMDEDIRAREPQLHDPNDPICVMHLVGEPYNLAAACPRCRRS